MNQTIAVIYQRLSLSFLWVMSGAVSLYDPSLGYELLGMSLISTVCIYTASLLDIALGFWVLSGIKSDWAAFAQISVIVVYTSLLTFIAPEYWLHPFGVLTKNIGSFEF